MTFAGMEALQRLQIRAMVVDSMSSNEEVALLHPTTHHIKIGGTWTDLNYVSG